MVQISGRFSNLRSQASADQGETQAGMDSGQTQVPDNGLDDELVLLVADRVYQRLLQDLRIDRERLRWTGKKRMFRKGGR